MLALLLRISIKIQYRLFYQIDYCLYDSLPEDTSYFHAQWRRQAITEIGKDYVILDNVKGSGHYVGTYLGLSALQRYWWGEGEVKFYIDGDENIQQYVEQEWKTISEVPGVSHQMKMAEL